MAYDVFIRPLNSNKKHNQNTGGWFYNQVDTGSGCYYNNVYEFDKLYPNKFKKVLVAGDIDWYGQFSKSELLQIANNFAKNHQLPNSIWQYRKQVVTGKMKRHWTHKRHYQLLTMLKSFDDDAMFHIDAIYWETGN